jgi:hypothetical protein
MQIRSEYAHSKMLPQDGTFFVVDNLKVACENVASGWEMFLASTQNCMIRCGLRIGDVLGGTQNCM